MGMCVTHVYWDQKTNFGNEFSPSIRWVLGTELRSSINVASIFIHSHLAAHHSFTAKPMGKYKGMGVGVSMPHTPRQCFSLQTSCRLLSK